MLSVTAIARFTLVAELVLRLPARYKLCLIDAKRRVIIHVKTRYTRKMTGKKVLIDTKSIRND